MGTTSKGKKDDGFLGITIRKSKWDPFVYGHYSIFMDVVVSDEYGDKRTNETISPQTVLDITGMIRTHYEFQDFDLDKRNGALICAFPQMIKPDIFEYENLALAQEKVMEMMMKGEDVKLRFINNPGSPKFPEPDAEKRMYFYKQRIIPLIFIGEKRNVEILSRPFGGKIAEDIALKIFQEKQLRDKKDFVEVSPRLVPRHKLKSAVLQHQAEYKILLEGADTVQISPETAIMLMGLMGRKQKPENRI